MAEVSAYERAALKHPCPVHRAPAGQPCPGLDPPLGAACRPRRDLAAALMLVGRFPSDEALSLMPWADVAGLAFSMLDAARKLAGCVAEAIAARGGGAPDG